MKSKTKLIIKSGLIVLLQFAIGGFIYAQEEEEETSPLVITGSIDTYYTYDFSGQDNISTSFADDRNSISIGMLDVGLSQSLGKASFVGEFSFGPRSFKSIPLFDTGDEDEAIVGIQNLYASYAFTDKLSVTAGYMGTFVGYEIISPTGNFNYSTSYLFTNGPFQNSGIKLDYAVSDNFAFMVGLFNDWNVYIDDNGVSDLGAQVFFAPADGYDFYLNFVTGHISGTIIDLTAGLQISDAFYLGLNAADYSISGDGEGGYSGLAFYPQYTFSDLFSLGYRGEFFAFKEFKDENDVVTSEKQSVFASTITGNFSLDNLTFITEFRLDSSEDAFIDSDEMPTSSASQITLAAVYAF